MGRLRLLCVSWFMMLSMNGLQPVFASVHQDSFMPENELHRDDFLQNNGMTEELFYQIIDEAIAIYEPIISQLGGRLVVNKLWNNSTVNASAQQSGGRWIVNMYGGLSRRNEVTADGFALVVCHELGHHLGGVPLYPGWAASEGQSDYFATLACAQLLWKEQLEVNATYRTKILELPNGEVAKNACDQVYSQAERQNLCYRSVAGGHSLAHLLSSLRRSPVPRFDLRDENQVSRTQLRHPLAQCRLDTYVAGALCQAEWNHQHIPGKNFADQKSLLAYIDAKPYSCHRYEDVFGARPRCWFNPTDINRPEVSSEVVQLNTVLRQDGEVRLDPVTGNKGDTIHINISGTGDADLYVRQGQAPTLEAYDCRPFLFGSKEKCTVSVQAQTSEIYAMAVGWSEENEISMTLGFQTTAKICRDFAGGKGDLFPCWEDYDCKLITYENPENRMNWCIDY